MTSSREVTGSVRGVAEVNGAELHYELGGSGTPVVLIHGFSFDMRSWDPQCAAMAERHTLLRYDMRGFGRSSTPGTLSYSHVEDLAEVLRKFDIAPAHLVGLSLGANVALGLAMERPGMVRSLVLASSGLPGHAWREERPPDAAMAHAKRHGVAATRDFWLGQPIFASVQDNPEARAKLTEIVTEYSGWHWENHNPMAPFTASAERLTEVAAPTLVVSGGRDVAGYREIADVLATGIPGAQKLDLPEAGHVLTLEVPDRFNAAVLAFISNVDRG